MPVPFCGCLIWIGNVTTRGYGKISYQNKTLLAHRVSWELANNRRIPDGLFVCHRCDEPSCVNPCHLFLGTPKENMVDMVFKGRSKPPRLFIEHEIKLIRATERQTRILADRFGVSLTTIKKIRSRRTYAHVS
ncbi:HNH endonuclease signature motif containing protein [Rhizobium leguminosarum]